MIKNLIHLSVSIIAALTITSCEKARMEEYAPNELKFKSCGVATNSKNKKERYPASFATPTFDKDASCYTLTAPPTGPNPLTCRMQFGYNNPSGPQTYPVGDDNYFTFPILETGCTGKNCGQPTSFASGSFPHSFVLNTTTAGQYKWTIKDVSAQGECSASLLPKCAGGPLPVTFSSVSAQWDHRRIVNVRWTTESESNNNRFVVQMVKPCHSTSEKIDVATVPTQAAGGFSGSTLNYTTPVAVDEGGNYYFSISQIDRDGTATSSNIVSVRIGN